jgi:hypothetical protein
MLMVRARAITCLLMASAALGGCSSVGRFDTAPSHEIDLSGSWALDHAASTDPQPLLDKLRPKPRPNYYGGPPDDGTGMDNGQPPDDSGPQQGGPGQGGGGGRRRGGGGQQQQQQMQYRNGNDAYIHMTLIKAVRADLSRAEAVTVRQTPDRFSLDYGSSVRTFTPGAVSVVGADWGVADQSSGWKGKEYVIEIKPQTGVPAVEKYTLSSDGKHLIEDLRLGGGEFPVVQLKRVYNHTDKPLPRAGLPSND